MGTAKLARAAARLNLMLVLMTEDRHLAFAMAAARTLPRGSLVVLRARDPSRRAELAAGLKSVARARGLVLLIASGAIGDPVLARGVHGLHLAEAKARQAAGWRARRPGLFITVAAHSLSALLRASAADAVLLSPVFPTESHAHAPALGAARARLMARAVPMKVIALGGVTAARLHLLKGFAGVAAISALTARCED